MDGPYSQGYDYDPWGNVTHKYGWGGEVQGGGAGQSSDIWYTYANNRRTDSGFNYDASGKSHVRRRADVHLRRDRAAGLVQLWWLLAESVLRRRRVAGAEE